MSGVRSRVAKARHDAKVSPSGAGQSACPSSQRDAAQSPIRSATTPGQSVPVASSARSAIVGSGTTGESGARAASRSAPVSSPAARAAASRSASVTRPSSIIAATSARGRISRAPATRARRIAAVARGSPACPSQGLTATVAVSGKAGGTWRTAPSAAAISSSIGPGKRTCCMVMAGSPCGRGGR